MRWCRMEQGINAAHGREYKRMEALGADVKMSTLVMDSRQTELLQVLLVEDNALDAKFITGLLCFLLRHCNADTLLA